MSPSRSSGPASAIAFRRLVIAFDRSVVTSVLAASMADSFPAASACVSSACRTFITARDCRAESMTAANVAAPPSFSSG
ncbi:MAG: hypothetical protein WCP62_12145, partial [Planctomycetota bacterium]